MARRAMMKVVVVDRRGESIDSKKVELLYMIFKINIRLFGRIWGILCVGTGVSRGGSIVWS